MKSLLFPNLPSAERRSRRKKKHVTFFGDEAEQPREYVIEDESKNPVAKKKDFGS